MIDTLKLRLNEYELTKDNKFTFDGSSFNSDGETQCSYFLTKIEDQEIHGKKGYYNNEFYNCSISNDYSEKNNLIIQFSLPRLYSKSHNLLSLDYKQTNECLHTLQKELIDNGIKTNLFDSTILRLDSFKNIETEKSFNYYKDIFSGLGMSRKKERDYGNTMLFYNTLSSVCIYDKIQEMKDKHKRKYIDLIPSNNVIRFENRLLKKTKVLKELEYNTLNTLTTKDGFNQIVENYHKTMKKDVFKFNSVGEFKFVSYNKLYNEISFFKENFKRNYIDSWLKFKGVENVMKTTFLDTIFDVIVNIENDNDMNKRYKRKRDLKLLFEKYETIGRMIDVNDNENFTLYDLYKELEIKMFNKVS